MFRNRRQRLALLGGGLVAAVAAMVVTFSSVAGAATLFSDDFSDGDTSGWSKSGGTWSVVTDGSAAVRQSSATSENARLFAGTASWTDYSVQARVKPLGTTGLVGLLARASGSTKFYRLALVAGSQAQLQVVNGSSVTVLASVSRTFAAGTWYTLRLEVSGTTVRATVDGAAVGQGTSSVSPTGRIGLQTLTATATFDDVLVSSAGSPPSTSPSSSPTVSPTTSPTVSPTSPPPTGTLIVATNGNDANPGTLAQPLRTIQRGVDLVAVGGTIAVRGGTYAPTTTIKVLKDGTSANPITLTNYNGERVIIDGEAMPYTPGAVDSSIPRADRGALHVEGDWWRFIGLEIINGPYGVFGVDTNNGVYDRLITRDNYESGLHLQGASAGNQILNLDSFGNRDPRNNGESADGLAIKEGSGTGNVVRGARLWFNSDDGFDAWEFLSPITIENSVAYGNGYNRWSIPNYSGDGNGFKLGGGDVDLPAAHVTRNSMAWDNSAGGFIDNANPGALVLDRNTAWRNGGTGFDTADSAGTLTRNLAVANGTNQSLGSSTNSNNSWNIGGTWTFVSTDAATITGPRTAAGAIATSTFLRPSNGADVGARS